MESCPQKDAIFKTIRTWEDARVANAFPRSVKKMLADPLRSWSLEKDVEMDTWNLYEKFGGEKMNLIILTRADGY